MAFSAGDADRIFRSAQGRYASNSDRSTPYTRRELSDALARDYAQFPGYTRSAVENIASRVFDSAAAARVMQDEPDVAVPAFNLPLDQSLDVTQGRFGYRVLVTCNSLGGLPVEVPVTVYSDSPLSGDDISQLGLSGYGDRLPDYYDTRLGQPINQTQCTTEIVFAGRTR